MVDDVIAVPVATGMSGVLGPTPQTVSVVPTGMADVVVVLEGRGTTLFFGAGALVEFAVAFRLDAVEDPPFTTAVVILPSEGGNGAEETIVEGRYG